MGISTYRRAGFSKTHSSRFAECSFMLRVVNFGLPDACPGPFEVQALQSVFGQGALPAPCSLVTES